MLVVRKSFAEFAAELAARLRAGRSDQPIAGTAQMEVSSEEAEIGIEKTLTNPLDRCGRSQVQEEG